MRSHAIRKTASDRILNAINIGVLSLVLLVVLYPLYFVIIASFSDPNAVYNGQVLFWPRALCWKATSGFSATTSFGAAI